MSFTSSIFDSTPTPTPTPTVLSEPLPPLPTVTYHLPKSITIDGGDVTIGVSIDDSFVSLILSNGDADYDMGAQVTVEEARALAYWLLMYAKSLEADVVA
jgi:hypothetical protein